MERKGEKGRKRGKREGGVGRERERKGGTRTKEGGKGEEKKGSLH